MTLACRVLYPRVGQFYVFQLMVLLKWFFSLDFHFQRVLSIFAKNQRFVQKLEIENVKYCRASLISPKLTRLSMRLFCSAYPYVYDGKKIFLEDCTSRSLVVVYQCFCKAPRLEDFYPCQTAKNKLQSLE